MKFVPDRPESEVRKVGFTALWIAVSGLTTLGIVFIFVQMWRMTKLYERSNRLFWSTAAIFVLVPLTLAGYLLRWSGDAVTVVIIFTIGAVGFWLWCSLDLKRKQPLNGG